MRYVSSISASTKHIYSIPLELTGVALTCMGFGWPPPSIRWTNDSGALPTGVTSVVTTKQGRVKANLKFNTPFSASQIGIYKCEIVKPGGQNVIEVSFQVLLYHGKSQAGGKANECQETISNSFLFQLRVLNAGCTARLSKEQERIIEEFQNLLYRTVLSLCNCDLERNHISVILMQCSKYKEGAVLFRGSVQTNSSSMTGTIFCILYRWKMSGALVSVNGLPFALDNRCSEKLDSYETEECVESRPSFLDLNITSFIKIISAIIICIFVMLMCLFLYCYCFQWRGFM